mmetsp:Transcript_17207/g.46932  ORF Transcript_17207/g.46932 Transcript_17207/m.46932 type:complete len:227 (+) Transcript_17207:1079-1759(+)
MQGPCQHFGRDLRTLRGDVLRNCEDAKGATAPSAMLVEEPGQKQQEAPIVDHPPNIDGTVMHDISRHLAQALHRQHCLLHGESCGYHTDEVDRFLRVRAPTRWPVQQHCVGDDASDACQLDDIIGAFRPIRCDDDFGETGDAFILHDCFDDALFNLGDVHNVLAARLGLQHASDDAESPAFPKLRVKLEDLSVLDAPQFLGDVDSVKDEDLRPPVDALVLRGLQVH